MTTKGRVNTVMRGVRAAFPAAIISGAPSTGYALVTGADPLEATRAAGTLVLDDDADGRALILAGLAAHAGISVLWGCVLAAVLPRTKPVAWGALAGASIAMLDLGVIAKRFPRIRALPSGPQVADHVAFGIVTAVALDRQRRREESP